MSWKHLHPTWKLCWVISDRLIYLFDGVPNSTSHESKTPSNSSFFYQFYPPTASHHPTTKTSHPPKDNFAPKQNHANLFLLAVFFFCVFRFSLLRSTQTMMPFSSFYAETWEMDFSLDSMWVEKVNSNKSSPTKNGGVFFRWWFSSHKIPIYQQKITNTKQTHPSEEILWEGFIQTKHSLPDSWKWRMRPCKMGKREAYRNEIPPTKKFGGSITDRISSPHLLQMPPPQLP